VQQVLYQLKDIRWKLMDGVKGRFSGKMVDVRLQVQGENNILPGKFLRDTSGGRQ